MACYESVSLRQSQFFFWPRVPIFTLQRVPFSHHVIVVAVRDCIWQSGFVPSGQGHIFGLFIQSIFISSILLLLTLSQDTGAVCALCWLCASRPWLSFVGSWFSAQVFTRRCHILPLLPPARISAWASVPLASFPGGEDISAEIALRHSSNDLQIEISFSPATAMISDYSELWIHSVKSEGISIRSSRPMRLFLRVIEPYHLLRCPSSKDRRTWRREWIDFMHSLDFRFTFDENRNALHIHVGDGGETFFFPVRTLL